jgi:hypothetical protein
MELLFLDGEAGKRIRNIAGRPAMRHHVRRRPRILEVESLGRVNENDRAGIDRPVCVPDCSVRYSFLEERFPKAGPLILCEVEGRSDINSTSNTG